MDCKPYALRVFAFLVLLWVDNCILVLGIPFPNEITTEPEVQCGQDTISISVQTSNGLPSRIFAKGNHNTPSCYFENTGQATFSLSNCNMNRQRQLEPRGLSYSLVVVVQLHPLFITKVDRAYSVRCFYMEADKAVSSFLDVSMVATETITAGHAMPQCMYVLHAGSPNGPSVRYARVGDKVWHVWECPSDVYGMLVHSCVVTDGQGSQIQILDENGCGVDQFVIGTPQYATDLTRAQQETHVFKFADKIAVRFNCQIKLCFKNGGGCDGITPPTCPDSGGQLGQNIILTTAEVPEKGATIRLADVGKGSVDDEVATEVPETPSAPLTEAPTTQKPEALGVINEGTESVPVAGENVTLNDTTQTEERSTALTEELTSESLILANGTSPTSPPENETTTYFEVASDSPVEGSGEAHALDTNDVVDALPRGSLEAPRPLPDSEGPLVVDDIRGRRNVMLGVARDDPIRALLHEQDSEISDGDLEVDVNSEMFVLEPEEQIPPAANRRHDLGPRLRAIDASEQSGDEICMSTGGFGIVMASFVLMILFCSVAILALCMRSRSLKSQSTNSLYSLSTPIAATSGHRLRMYNHRI